MKNTRLILAIALFAATAGLLGAQQQPVVAVAPFNAVSGISETDADLITRAFFLQLGSTNTAKLVDREVANQAIRERSFMAGDWSNRQKTAELGEALNADWIVRGEIEMAGANIVVTVQFYDIRAFEFRGGGDLRLANAGEADNMIDPLVESLVRIIAVSPVATPVRPETPDDIIYNIGETGPAGGIVFYDKGFFSDGWRYLEAAPVGAEFTAQWASYEQNVPGTDTSVESGKRNTQLIVAHLGSLGESSSAAQICVALNVNGFTDWFLPSKDELDLMYTNLGQKNLGGFKTAADAVNYTNRYWSSSHGDTNLAWYQDFYNGGQDHNYGFTVYSIRAARAF